MPRRRVKLKSGLISSLFGPRGLLRGRRKLLRGKKTFGGSTIDSHVTDIVRAVRKRRSRRRRNRAS